MFSGSCTEEPLTQQFEARRGRTGGQRRCNRLAVTFASECGYPLAVGFPSDIRAAAEVFAPFAVCLITAVDRGGNNGRAARRDDRRGGADGNFIGF